MTAEAQLSKMIDEAFRAAYFLSGSSERAENAVLDGIAALDFTGTSEQTLVVQTVRALMRQQPQVASRCDGASTCLPLELQRLALLPPLSRDCFVLRVLYKMTPGICCSILNLTVQELQDALCAAYQALPFLETCTTNQHPRPEGIGI